MSDKDKLREAFDQVAERLNFVNKPKRLIEAGKIKSEFIANGNTYYICPPEKVFNFAKWNAYQQLEQALGLNKTPQEIYDSFKRLYDNQIRLMSDTKDNWLTLQSKNMLDCLNCLDSMKPSDYQRLPMAYYLCTLFIVRKGADLSYWNVDLAQDYINDWTEENLSPYDFFHIALVSSKELQEISLIELPPRVQI